MAPHISDHIKNSPISSISSLSRFSAIILSIVLIIQFFVRFYILQQFLLPKLYGSKYTQLNDANRRNFLNHHIACAVKLAIFIIGVYPFGSVVFGGSHFHSPFIHGSRVTMGDILLVATQMLTGMFIFDLLYRINIPPVSVAHHIASVMVAQIVIAISIQNHQVSSIAFLLCSLWGAFYIVAEFPPHLAMIFYRVYPTSHSFLANIFKSVCIVTFIGTVIETVLTMYMFGTLWHRWPLSFKIIIPLLHIAFSAAQLQGTRVFYLMWKNQESQEKKTRK